MNPYTGNFAPQQNAMQQPQQAPQMAPGNQSLNYQQQMAQSLMNQPSGEANGMQSLTGVIDMINKFKQMSQPESPVPPVPPVNTPLPKTMNFDLPSMMA